MSRPGRGMALLRAALERFVADLPWRDGNAVLRIASVIASKQDPAVYWIGRGRRRFGRELAEDGLAPAVVADALKVVDEVISAQAVDLDAILEDLVRRSGS